jgi:hypothetical protein
MAVSNLGNPSWPRLLAQWRLSGLTQAEFCARRGLSLPTFRYHLYKPRPRSGSPGPIAPTDPAETTPLFLPVVCSSSSQPDRARSAAASLEIILDDGLRIAVAPGFDPQTLRRLVDALRRPPC